MSRLIWDNQDDHSFEVGLKQGVLHIHNQIGLPWNGLISVTQSPDSDFNESHYDGEKVFQYFTPVALQGSIEAFTYPNELEDAKFFDLSYVVSLAKGYDLHIIYNILAKQVDNKYDSINDSEDPVTFSWDFSTTPILLEYTRPVSHIIINSNETLPEIMSILEDVIYGDEDSNPRIPNLAEIIGLFESLSIFVITDNGDGTWTAAGPEDFIEMIDPTLFKITSPSAYYIDSTTYKISSW